jgi:hypothetical protein
MCPSSGDINRLMMNTLEQCNNNSDDDQEVHNIFLLQNVSLDFFSLFSGGARDVCLAIENKKLTLKLEANSILTIEMKL